MKTKNATTSQSLITYHYSPLTTLRLWRGFFLIPLTLALFALSPAPSAFGVTPAPDGGYPGFNTAEGEDALFSLTTGIGNTANGSNALYRNTTGLYNTAVGDYALASNTIGGANTATGRFALYSNKTIGGVSGHDNTATGYLALYSNTTGNNNTANGVDALFKNNTGYQNTATGLEALYSNTTGNNNTANGVGALYANTSGAHNMADGYAALNSNTTGDFNTANGSQALYSNTTAANNTADGFQALYSNTGGSNTANGSQALYSNTTASSNTADGFQALYHNTSGAGNTATGYRTLLNNNGSSNIAIGNNAGLNLTTGSGNVCIGAGVLGVAGESSTTRIKNVYASVASGRAVYVNSDNKIGTLVSSRRFKDEIKLMDKASETILALKPVTFRYKKEIEPHGAIMFGLIAEEVEKVDPELVTRNDKGEVETVRYDAVNAMLLNEFLKEHKAFLEEQRKGQQQAASIAALNATVAEQQKGMQVLTARLNEQAAQIQKVSVQLEGSRPAPQTVLNNH